MPFVKMSDLLVVCLLGSQRAEHYIETFIRYNMVQTLGIDDSQPSGHIRAQAAAP